MLGLGGAAAQQPVAPPVPAGQAARGAASIEQAPGKDDCATLAQSPWPITAAGRAQNRRVEMFMAEAAR